MLVGLLVGGNVGLSIAFTSFGSLVFLPSDFLRVLVVFDDFVDLADDILTVGQEISIFVNQRVPRRDLRAIDVGDVWERDKTFTVRSVNFFYRPVPLELCLASFSAFDDIRRLVGIRVHVWSGIAYERCRSWLISIGESRGIGDTPREVCDRQGGEELSKTNPEKVCVQKKRARLRSGATHK